MSLKFKMKAEKGKWPKKDWHKNAVLLCQVKCTKEEGKTKQSEADACDINKIMSRYINQGRLPEYIKENPQFGDFSETKDYLESMQIVVKAREQFELLPSAMRERCRNDPALFLEFVQDPKNREELVKMRLAKPRKEEGVELTPSAISKLAEGISGAIAGKTPPSQPSATQAPKTPVKKDVAK